MNVLVVEDDPNLAEFLGRSLEEAGYSVTLAATGDAVAKAVEARGFDLIVLDLCACGPSCIDAARRATVANPDCKLIVISGSAQHSRQQVFSLSPAVSATLRKPVDIEDLLSVCERLGLDRMHAGAPQRDLASVEFRP